MSLCFPTAQTLDSLGGALTDADGVGVVDPTTDLSASSSNVSRATVAAMSRVATLAWCRFVTSGTTPTLAATNAGDAAWGGNTSPKTPTVARTGAGVFTLTWPSTVTDEMGVTQSTNIHRAKAWVEGSTYQQQPQFTVTAPNVVTVYTFSSGTANDIAGTTIHVEVA